MTMERIVLTEIVGLEFFLINVAYSAQTSRIVFHFWAIVFVTCMTLKQ